MNQRTFARRYVAPCAALVAPVQDAGIRAVLCLAFQIGGLLDELSGKCFCGAVEIEVSGSPEAMGYCHCSSCRSWSGGPVNAFSLWKPESGAHQGRRRACRDVPEDQAQPRQYCSKCGGHLMTNHPPLGLVDVFAATLPGLAFKPGVHVNYAETVLPMSDGLPKLKDFPSEFGGTGEIMVE